ncbi:uncharacterized protein LOC122404574 [Colletes gigas]|uniref:uncharacterized protein LOC122404574 n=1 Tax=Colletes gigas TaxID=935657 RepID=UPI001C9B6FFB|nr:uncharacterized protein LOC122404574 [Colletes gigas]
MELIVHLFKHKMSWFFGKKEYQKEPQPEFIEEEQTSDSTTEGFVHIKKYPAPPPPLPLDLAQDATEYHGNNLYPYIPPGPVHSTTLPTDSTKDHVHGDGMHYLNDVPFKLCKQIEVMNDIEIDKLRISEVLWYIENIELQNYNYNFSVEEGVVSEMNSTNAE